MFSSNQSPQWAAEDFVLSLGLLCLCLSVPCRWRELWRFTSPSDLLPGLDGFIFSPSFFSPVSFGFGAAPSTISVTNPCHCFFPKVFCKYRRNPLGSFLVNDASGGGSESCCGPGGVCAFLWEKFRKYGKNGIICLICFLAWAGGWTLAVPCVWNVQGLVISWSYFGFVVLMSVVSLVPNSIVPNPVDFPTCSVLQAEFATEHGRRGLALVVPLGHRNKGWSGSQEFPCCSGEGNWPSVVSVWLFPSPLLSFLTRPLLYFFPLWYLMNCLPAVWFAGGPWPLCVFFHHRSSKLAVSDADFSLCWVLVSREHMQEWTAGVLVTFWNSILHHLCFLCWAFVGWATKAEQR